MGNNSLFSRQSIRIRLAESQSIPRITSNSCRGRQIRFTLYLRPSTSTGHLAHKDDVLTKPDAGVDTTRSHCNSQTGRPNLCTQVSDTKECVAPKSYKTHADLPAITQRPMTRLPEIAASCSSHGVHSARCLRPVASPPLLILDWGWNWSTRHCPHKGGGNLCRSGPPCHNCCTY